MTPGPGSVVTASAPGKCMLVGEYAVLEGAPALMCAINRRCHVRLEVPDGAIGSVRAPGLLSRTLRYHLGADTGICWQNASPEERDRMRLFESLVTASMRGAHDSADRAPNLPDCLLNSRALYLGQRKLGLGSSASMCVALGGALRKFLGTSPPRLADLQSLHFRFQGNKGSGADVAACLAGDTLIYRQTKPGHGQFRAVAIPENVKFALLWTGTSADTKEMLTRLSFFRNVHSRSYSVTMKRLRSIAEECVLAIQTDGGATDFLQAVSEFTDSLRDFAKLTGLPVFTASHARLCEAAKRVGLLYKPIGAGGGDLGMAISADPEKLAWFCAGAKKAGIDPIMQQIDPNGLQVQTCD